MVSKGRGRHKTTRKRLGQYFTPDWAVDYIIENTLGPTIAEDSDRLLGEFTILDPACGDGAFLIGALRFLEHKTHTVNTVPQELLLRSIVDSIHGIDIDPKTLKKCHTRLRKTSKQLLGVAADFSQRVLLGNSLIQPDSHAKTVYGSKLAKVHPVDWYRVYPWAMREGGFDVIVGNPPFIGIKALDTRLKTYLRHRYRTVEQQFDILVPFIELGLNLLRPGGRLGYIISNKVLAADYGIRLRQTLVKKYVIEQMVDLSNLNIFKDAATYPHILIIRKPRGPQDLQQHNVQLIPSPTQPQELGVSPTNVALFPQHYYATLPNTILSPSLSEEKYSILRKMLHNTMPLGQACSIRCGIAKTGFTRRLLSKDAYSKLSKTKKRKTLPFLNAGDVRRYHLRQRKYITYDSKLVSTDQWNDFKEPKLVIAGMAKQIRATLDAEGHALGRVYYITQKRAPYNSLFLLGLLNSRLINTYFTLLFFATHLRSSYIRYNATYLEQIPLPTPTKHQEDELVELVAYILKNPKSLKKGIDWEIDQTVANLYGLSEKDILQFEG
ncbi:MAG: Eco57I restriction-modification methylase domain-containing protein [Candidatus Odinarchaeota archaeon]